jgi:hypothetical protein
MQNGDAEKDRMDVTMEVLEEECKARRSEGRK